LCYEHFTSGIISYVSMKEYNILCGKGKWGGAFFPLPLGSADNEGITYVTILILANILYHLVVSERANRRHWQMKFVLSATFQLLN
jgi:hypothetical protein